MDERCRTGRRLLEDLLPGVPDRLEEALGGLAPDMLEFLYAFAASDVLARPGLGMADRELATVAALAAMGNARPQLELHLEGSLNEGLNPGELVEALYVVMVFAGFPAALNALAALKEVLARRGTPLPIESGPAPAGDRRERGLAALEATSAGAGERVCKALGAVAPDMADMIVDFSYGDVLARPLLTARRKEIVVLAATAARGSMLPQLKVHVEAALNVGVSREEIVETLMQMAVYAGFPAALNALFAAGEVFAQGT